MPDTVFDEDTLAAASEAMGEEEERPLTFAELGVPGPLVRVLAADDKKTAFPIQADTLPDSLAGRDILGRGRTGSGKTLAFSIPLVARLGEVDAGEYENMSQFRHEVNRVKQAHAEERRADDFVPHPRGLVLAPTRELANQINDVLMPPIGLLLGNTDFGDLQVILKSGQEAMMQGEAVVVPAVAEVALRYGVFINTVLDFLIVAFSIFMVVKAFNKLKKKQEEAPAPAPAPSAEETLLTEIRDLLKEKK